MKTKVLFVHDGPIVKDESSKNYFGIHITNDIVERYCFFGDKISFLMRALSLRKENISGHYTQLDHPAFFFIEIPNFKSLKSYNEKAAAQSIIEKAVDSHDMLIIRLPSAAGRIALKHAQKTNKPVLIEFVACVFDALWNYNWKGKLLAHYRYYSYFFLMKKVSHTIYVTNEFLQSRYPTKGKSIGCSDVVLQELDAHLLNKRLQKISSNDAPLVLGTVAAIDVKYKGQADVIQAISKLKKAGWLFKYRIVGQGDPARLKGIIKELDVEELVEIIGPLPHQKVFTFLDEIDVYIQPSRQEGLPRSVIEAMSRSLPCIGTDIAGIPQLLDAECLYNKHRKKELITILKKMDKVFLASQATRNFEKAKSYLSSQLDSKREEFYHTFLNDHKKELSES